MSSCSQQSGDGALHIAIKCISNSHTGSLTQRARVHRCACICIGCFQRHAFKNAQRAHAHRPRLELKKRCNGIQIPRLKVQLFAAKCSLQAVSLHKHSSNLSASPDFMLFLQFSKQEERRRRCPVRLGDKPAEIFSSISEQILSLPWLLYLLLFHMLSGKKCLPQTPVFYSFCHPCSGMKW